MKTYELENVEACLRLLDKAPENLLKVAKKALASASKKTVKYFKGGIPDRYQALSSYRVKQLRNGSLSATVGLFDKGKKGGHQPGNGADPVLDWFKAYWQNYGTLGGRDPQHNFREPVKKAKRARMPHGITARRFFERSTNGWQDVFVKEFKDYIDKHIKEI